jgi:hypothetical protein
MLLIQILLSSSSCPPNMPPSRRLIRRRPLLERIKAYLDPLDFLLWLSEELETSDWAQWQQTWTLPLGIGMNLTMLAARANSASRNIAYDDVFGDASPSIGFFSWLVSLLSDLHFDLNQHKRQPCSSTFYHSHRLQMPFTLLAENAITVFSRAR